MDEYLNATQWVNRRPYRSSSNDSQEQQLPLGPMLLVVGLVTNLRGWVKTDDICVRELLVNSTAAARLHPQPGEWQLGYDAERTLTIEQVNVQQTMEEIIDPS